MEDPSSYSSSVKRSNWKWKGNRSRKTLILPLYHEDGCASSRRALSRRSCIHVVPLIALLAFFILWWFSYPMDLEIKDGRITLVSHSDNETPTLMNETRVDLVFLAAIATPPYTSISHMQPVGNQNRVEAVNATD